MVALIRGLVARGQAHDRQLLGRPRAHDAADPAAARVRVRDRARRQRRDPELPRLHRRCTPSPARPRRSRAGPREPGSDQAARHQRRRLLQRELRAPVREPDRSATSSSSTRSCIIPFALAFTFGRMVKDKRQGYAVFAIMVVLWLGVQLRRDRSSSRAATRSSTRGRRRRRRSPRRRPAATWRARRSASGRRPRASVARVDDRHLERLGQLDARQLHAARRHACRSCNMKLGEVSPGGVGVGLNGLLSS